MFACRCVCREKNGVQLAPFQLFAARAALELVSTSLAAKLRQVEVIELVSGFHVPHTDQAAAERTAARGSHGAETEISEDSGALEGDRDAIPGPRCVPLSSQVCLVGWLVRSATARCDAHQDLHKGCCVARVWPLESRVENAHALQVVQPRACATCRTCAWTGTRESGD